MANIEDDRSYSDGAPWMDPDDVFYISSGNDTNRAGTGKFDKFAIFSEEFSQDQIRDIYVNGITLHGPGDANGDGKVDVSDLGVLATHYGTGTSAANVPEPNTITLLLCGLTSLLCLCSSEVICNRNTAQSKSPFGFGR